MKMIEAKQIMDKAQMTIRLLVNDFVITHNSQKAIDSIVVKLDSMYGSLTPLTAH